MGIIQMESEYWDKNPNKIPSKIFPKDFHFKPLAPNKTQKFYEFVLVDSDSVSVKHYKDKANPSNITHSTFQILKVFTPTEFGKNPNTIKKFSQNFDPIGYNYWDYIQAWTNVFWLQNKNFRHSWLIYFKRNVLYKFPQWFIQWWNFFGPINQILPAEALEGFQTFQKMFNSSGDPFPVDLHFYSKFSLAWIFSWQYQFGKHDNPNLLPVFQRQAFVKWWAEFDTSRANSDSVKEWFKKNPKHQSAFDPDSCRFLNQRSQIMAALGASSSKESFAQNLKDILKLLQTEEAEPSSKQQLPSSSSSSTSSGFYQNEDDCFGINLDEDC